MNSKQVDINIAVLGGVGVGKSCMINRFIQNMFIPKYDPTSYDIYRKPIVINGKRYNVQINDISQQDNIKFDMFDGYIIVFSLTSLSSLSDLYTIILKVQSNNPAVPIILCANKCDIVDDIEITDEMCTEISKKYDVPVFMTSAKIDKNIDQTFMCMIRLIIETKYDIKNILYKLKFKCLGY